MEHLQQAVNQLQGERQREYWSSASKQEESSRASASSPSALAAGSSSNNMLEYFRAEVATLRAQKAELETECEGLKEELGEGKRRLERCDLEGSGESAKRRRKAFEALGGLLQTYAQQHGWAEREFSLTLEAVLEVGVGVFKELQRQLGEARRGANEREYQLGRAREQLEAEAAAAQSKANYNENVLSILERNHKAEVAGLQR